MGTKIITDSLSGLPPSIAAQYGIEVIPHRVAFEAQTLREGVDISPQEFLQRLETSKKLPTTNPSTVDDFKAAFRIALATGDKVLFIAPSSKLSGSYQNAESARMQLSTPDLQVLDSMSFAAGQALLAIEAAQAASTIETLTGLVSHLKRLMPQLQVFFYVDQLDYLAKGGRIGGLQGFLGKLMKIKPVMMVQDGLVTSLTRVSSAEEGGETITGKLQEDLFHQPRGRLAVMHAGNLKQAQMWLDGLRIGALKADLPPLDMPAALILQTGRGAFGLAYFTYPPGAAATGQPHPAQTAISQASRAADQAILLTALSGGQSMLQVSSGEAARVVSKIDEALALTPQDVDLLVAKSAALRCAAQFKTAEEVLDQALAISPDHFEAKMIKEHWDSWKHLFQFPAWSTETTALHPIMAQKLQDKRYVQLVRDGLQISMAIIRPVRAQDFPRGLSSSIPCKWVPVWSKTPYGPILAHYLIVYDDPADPYKGEGFLSTIVEPTFNPESSYWLLRRMCHSRSCFLVLADGQQVLFNVRYVFPEALNSIFSEILSSLDLSTSTMDSAAFQRACQWHMNNFDMKNVG